MSDSGLGSAPVAIVTGAASGLGHSIALGLLADGYRVVASDISPTVGALGERWDESRLATIVVDMASADAGTRLVDCALSAFGQLDAVINNAGVGGPGETVEHVDIDDVRDVFEVNVLGPVRLCQAAIPHLKESGGRIVNVGSVFADEPVPEGSAYCMSKSAVKTLTQCLALELGDHGVTVNAVAPGYMLTKMHLDEIALQAARHGIEPEEQQRRLRESVPLNRHGDGDDVAGAVTWLLSPRASYVTGQTIGVNGGISFR